MKSYLEIQVPIKYDDLWFAELRNTFSDIPVKWQLGFYHITMAFLDETPGQVDLHPLLKKHLVGFPAPSFTFDKLDAFTTWSGMFIVHLTSTNIPEGFLALTEAIRSDMKAVGCKIDSEFRLHVTLGRLRDTGVALSDIQHLISSVRFTPITLTLTDVAYRVFRGRTIYETKLNNNKMLGPRT